MSLTTKNIATAVLGVAMVVSTFAFAAPAQAQSIADLQAMINQLLAQIAALQGGSTPVGGSCVTFSQNHQMGDTGGQVMDIQKFLNSHGAQVAATGAGSPGNESSYFGAKTRAAIAAWQAANGVSPAAGYWGPITRAKANSMCVPGTGTGTGTPVTGNGLKVMLAAGSPNNVALVQGQGIAELARYTFSNPTGSEVTVTSIGFNRIGASTDSAIDNVYLFKDVTRLTDPAGISQSAFNFNDSAGLFKVPAGGSVTVSVRADIDSAANGQQVGVSLVSVGTTATLDSSVVFPVAGGIQTISAATIASVSWTTTSPSGGTFAPSTDTTVFLNTLTVNNRAVWLKSVQFENRGSSDPADFQNFKLYVKGTQVGGTPMLSGDKIIFDLSASPLRMETGGNEFKLVADIVGGSGETFDFQIRRGIDINLVDSELNQNLAPTAPAAATAVNIEGVGLSVVKAASSPTDNVAVASTGVEWAKYEFRASGDDLKVEELGVDVDETFAGGMDNVRIMLDGVQVGSTVDVADSGTSVSLGSSMILKAGKTHIVQVYGDAKTSTSTNYASGNTVLVEVFVDADDTEGMSSGDRLGSDVGTSLSDGIDGNTRTISSSSLTATKFSGYGNQTIVAGTNNARIGSFTLSTGSTEGLNVNTIVVDLSGNTSASVTDVRLVDNSNGQQIGSTKTSPSSSNTFSINLALAKSQTKTIDVYANVKSGIPAGTMVVTIGASTGGTGATTGQSVTVGGSGVALQTITVGSGTLTVTRDPGTPVNANVIAGSTMVHVGKFDFDAQNSAYTVQELMVKVPADAATSVSNVTLKYKNQAGVEQTVSQALALSSGSQTHATATFTGLTFYVPLNDSADVDVYVDVPTTTSGAKSGAAIAVSLDWDNGFKAIDGAGTQSTSFGSADKGSNDSTGYGTKYVKKSVPVLARLSTGYTANTVASGTGLYRFTVTADAAGSIEWREISFTVTTSGDAGTRFHTWQLYDVTGTATQIGSNVTDIAASTLQFCPGTSCTIGEAEQIGAGSSKTYELRATVADWDSGDSLAISFAEDTSAVVNAAAASVSGNMTWSDRSASSHATTTADWTNGYLVKDMDNDTRSCQISTATTCTP